MYQSNETNLELRSKFLGGTDIAGIMGISKYKTPLDVFYAKVYGAKTADNKYMKAGRYLESSITHWACDILQMDFVNPVNPYIHVEHEFLGANIDGLLSDKGNLFLLEVKTSRKDFDEIPDDYFCQIQHYLDVLGLDKGYMALLVAGLDFKIFEIEKDNDFIEMKNSIAIEFWKNNVLAQKQPEPKKAVDIENYFKKLKRNCVEATKEDLDTIKELKELKAQIKLFEEKEYLLEEQLKLKIADNEGLKTIEGDVLISWKQAKATQSFDKEAFKKENKELYAKYLVTKEGSRRFLVK